jgi:hypothetical protein
MSKQPLPDWLAIRLQNDDPAKEVIRKIVSPLLGYETRHAMLALAVVCSYFIATKSNDEEKARDKFVELIDDILASGP